ncbi:uncharacterized protein LOC129308888 [Prosopis cineraria]|uniref:uncharacterized protein LOC129308888 n=1 Tax=Prosopis cineraria TaxID=364024 RepID=UPI00240F236F|nr:uncharacterized protein LOC129308888 [Prosopis cineraria]
MASGSKSSKNNIYSMLSCVATTLMFLSILNVPIKSQARDMSTIFAGPAYAEEAAKCFSALTDVPGCTEGMYIALFGNFSWLNDNRHCCEAILEENDDHCWDKLYPMHSDIPQIYKHHCTAFLEPSPSPSPSSWNGSDEMGTEDVEQCWDSLRNIEGCVESIFYALIHGDFAKVGQQCCLAIESVAYECWLKMFPWNPFFPTLLTGFCRNNNHQSPSV